MKHHVRLLSTLGGTALLLSLASPQATPTMRTRWASKVTPQNVHREYPRPQLVRPNWVNLNGQWDLAIVPSSAPRPGTSEFRRKILVPFPVESLLSGVNERVPEGSTVWYRRTFSRPKGERVLLHFGAVDWDSTVWVNGREIGRHQGGFDPFSFDVTSALRASGPNEVVVAVKDPTDAGPQPRGKQVRRPEGIYYTPTTGIWQTVWLEGVPQRSIESVKFTPKLDGSLRIDLRQRGEGASVRWAEVLDGNRVVARGTALGTGSIRAQVSSPKLWSPESPFLYRVRVGLGRGKGSDVVESYVGFREVSIGRAPDGKTRLMLNGKPIFMAGPLDQGFWPDGLFTAPTDDALKYDIEVTKRLGFNMIRKHVKVEPARWYHWCDKMGILVWQDMPSGERSIGPNDPDIKRTPESQAIFERELKAMIDALYNHPSIVTWVVFNEGWGQYDTARMSKWTKDYDPTRLVDAVSGWADRKVGDMHDWHVYPGPGSPQPEPTRAAVLGEFGGLGLVTPGHMWRDQAWGYQSFKTPQELTDNFLRLFTNLRFLIGSPGLSAAVYTQTTDVETEANGLMTYDREVLKMDEATVRRAVMSLYGPPPVVETILATSELAAQTYRYTFTQPASDWAQPGFSDTAWTEGKGGFGTAGTPGAVIGTVWSTPDIWLRRQVEIPAGTTGDDLYLRVIHDDAAEIYIDGKLVANLTGWTGSYIHVPVPKGMLTPGRHTIAMKVHQDRGGQSADVGVVRIVEPRR